MSLKKRWFYWFQICFFFEKLKFRLTQKWLKNDSGSKKSLRLKMLQEKIRTPNSYGLLGIYEPVLPDLAQTLKVSLILAHRALKS